MTSFCSYSSRTLIILNYSIHISIINVFMLFHLLTSQYLISFFISNSHTILSFYFFISQIILSLFITLTQLFFHITPYIVYSFYSFIFPYMLLLFDLILFVILISFLLSIVVDKQNQVLTSFLLNLNYFIIKFVLLLLFLCNFV